MSKEEGRVAANVAIGALFGLMIGTAIGAGIGGCQDTRSRDHWLQDCKSFGGDVIVDEHCVKTVKPGALTP